jgi:hypothetical protein
MSPFVFFPRLARVAYSKPKNYPNISLADSRNVRYIFGSTGGPVMAESHPNPGVQQNVAECSGAKSPQPRPARYILDRKDLTERQRTAAQLLLQGDTDSEVARKIGVDRATIGRWRKTPSFRREVELSRTQLWQKSVGRLHSLIEPSLSILEQQLNGENKLMALRAAAILLRLAGPARLPRVSLDGGEENPVSQAKRREQAEWDEVMAYVNAPMPGREPREEDEE